MEPGLVAQGQGQVHPRGCGHQPGTLRSRWFPRFQQLSDRLDGETEAGAGRLVQVRAEAAHQGVVAAAAGDGNRGIVSLAHQPEHQPVVEVEMGLEARIELQAHPPCRRRRSHCGQGVGQGLEQGDGPEPLLQLVEHSFGFTAQGQEGAEALPLRSRQVELFQSQRIEAGERPADGTTLLRRRLAEQSVEEAMVPHQEGGAMRFLQAQGGHRCQEQLQQLRVGRRGALPQQLDTTLKFLMDPLSATIADGGAEGGATGPETQGPGATAHATAGGPGDRCGELGPQAEGFIRRQPQDLATVDRSAGLEGGEPFDRGRCYLLVAPEAVDPRQQFIDAAIALHRAGLEIPGAGSWLQSHGGERQGGGVAVRSYGAAASSSAAP